MTLSPPLRCLATRTIVFLRDNVGNRGERVKHSHNSISNCTIEMPSALIVTACTSWLRRWPPPDSFTEWQNPETAPLCGPSSQRVRNSTEGKRETFNLWCLRTDETIPVAHPSRARRMAETGRVKLVRFYTVNTKSKPTQKLSKYFPQKIKADSRYPHNQLAVCSHGSNHCQGAARSTGQFPLEG